MDYILQSLYKVVNFRGVQRVLFGISKSLLRVHYFLWLLTKNKLLTRDNLGKIRKVENDLYLLSDEKESVFDFQKKKKKNQYTASFV